MNRCESAHETGQLTMAKYLCCICRESLVDRPLEHCLDCDQELYSSGHYDLP